MRHWHKEIVIAGLALALAGCASVQVSGPPAAEETAPVQTHWTMDQARPPAESDGYRPPLRLAVLLPMTGPLATAAAPVHDGLLAGYYGERRQRPELVFYDTATGASAAHARAVAEGADQILGPLGREEVAALFESLSGPPLIALNRGHGPPPPNATAFSLAPEDDGAAIADYLAGRNARRLLVLSNGDDSAQRALAVLRGRLQETEGAAVDVLAVAGDAPELTEAMRASAAKEGGIDAVVLAVRGSQARLLAPQLFAAGLGDRLRVATGQITSGTGKPEEDRALDGIVFPTETWLSGRSGPLPAADGVAQSLPTARGPAARLFAFGYDAWLLSGYLERLGTAPGTRLNGTTGVLQLDAAGNLLRTPAWAAWSGGQVVPHGGD